MSAGASGVRLPLHDAALAGSIDDVMSLLGTGADLNAAGPRRLRAAPAGAARPVSMEDGWRPLHYACVPAAGKTPAMIGILIGAGAEPDLGDGNDRPPLHLLASLPPALHEALDPDETWSVQAATLLIEGGADVNRISGARRYLNTALHRAAFFGRKRMIELLLECGARINARDGRGLTALDAALRGGHDSQGCRFLLESHGGVGSSEL